MRRGRKPSKEAALKRLKNFFHRDRFDERDFKIYTDEESPFVKVKYKDNKTILKIHPLQEKYGVYTKLPSDDTFPDTGKFSSNLDDFEEDFKEVRDKWL